VTVGTTVDDLIDLKDNAVAVSYRAVEAVLAVFGETAEGAMGELLAEARDVRDRAELYDAADEDDQAVSIEHHEALESLCELENCPMRDPHNPAGHKRRECERNDT
jgi:hypothetical protein